MSFGGAPDLTWGCGEGAAGEGGGGDECASVQQAVPPLHMHGVGVSAVVSVRAALVRRYVQDELFLSLARSPGGLARERDNGGGVGGGGSGCAKGAGLCK